MKRVDRPRLILVGVALLAAAAVAAGTDLVLVTADEVIYMVGTRKLIEQGSLDTNFYLPESLVTQGYPHRDVHMPGYLFALVPFVIALGPGIAAAAALNLALLVAMVLLVYAIALRALGDPRTAFTAAALCAVLPPFTGYLYVAFPEFILPVLLLGGVWLLLGHDSQRRAALAGALFGLGPLFRENLLFAFPIFFALMPMRRLATAFGPAALAVGSAVYWLFGSGRAQLPNAVYPAILFESLRSAEPVTRFVEALSANFSRNLILVAEARPFHGVEDAALLLLLLLAIGATAGALRTSGLARRLGIATVISCSLMLAAVMSAYAVRATGRPWAGVRQFMAWEPLLLIFALGAFPAARLGKGLAVAALLVVFAGLGVAHVRFVNEEWKGRDLRASQRFIRHVAPWIDPARPRRVAVRSNDAFLYGATRFPVEVIWPIRSFSQLAAVEKVIDFDFLVVPRTAPMLSYLDGNARYRHVNRHDPGGQYYVWQRLY